jgi:hypothetical protein
MRWREYSGRIELEDVAWPAGFLAPLQGAGRGAREPGVSLADSLNPRLISGTPSACARMRFASPAATGRGWRVGWGGIGPAVGLSHPNSSQQDQRGRVQRGCVDKHLRFWHRGKTSMSNLEQFLNGTPGGTAEGGALGSETDWLFFTTLKCRSGRLLVSDPAFLPEASDGMVLSCPAGDYRLEAKVLDFGGDRRISRLRGLLNGRFPESHGMRGEVVVETGRIGVCDWVPFSRAWKANSGSMEDKLESSLEEADRIGVFRFGRSSNAALCFVESGFGDGNFPVTVAMAEHEPIGFEIEFIERNKPYPFEYSKSARSPSGQLDLDDDAGEAIRGALAQFRHTGDRQKDRALLRRLLEEQKLLVLDRLRKAAE